MGIYAKRYYLVQIEDEDEFYLQSTLATMEYPPYDLYFDRQSNKYVIMRRRIDLLSNKPEPVLYSDTSKEKAIKVLFQIRNKFIQKHFRVVSCSGCASIKILPQKKLGDFDYYTCGSTHCNQNPKWKHPKPPNGQYYEAFKNVAGSFTGYRPKPKKLVKCSGCGKSASGKESFQCHYYTCGEDGCDKNHAWKHPPIDEGFCRVSYPEAIGKFTGYCIERSSKIVMRGGHF